MKVFPDANFFVAAGLRPHGDDQKVLDRSQDKFVTSEHVLSEVARNLERLQRDPTSFISSLRRFVQITDQFDLLPAGLPLTGTGDRQALAEAIGSGCNMFVTTDTDFAALFGQTVKGVLIEKCAVYALSILKGGTT